MVTVVKETGGIGKQRKTPDHPDNSIFKIDFNTEKNPETWEDFLSLRLQWKTTSKRWCENLGRNSNNNNGELFYNWSPSEMKKRKRKTR